MLEMQALHPNIDVLDHFTYATTPVRCRCSACGYEWSARPSNLTFRKKPTGCPRCAGSLHKTQQVFVSEVERVHPEMKVIDSYADSHTPITVRCLRHNCDFDISPTNLLRRSSVGCPNCTQERHDGKLAADLKAYCLSHFDGTVTEYQAVKNPKTGRWLPFDIYIPDLNGVSVYCEVMGDQHYRYIPYIHRRMTITYDRLQETIIKRLMRDKMGGTLKSTQQK